MGQSGERLQALVIGAGQAGLSAGYHLARRGLRFLIVDGCQRVGDVWRRRWDSLRLFTPARLDGLDGLPFPAAPDTFPTKDEMADYLEAYARRFALPVRTGFKVERLWRSGSVYRVQSGVEVLEADAVVVAMGSFQAHRRPAFAASLDPAIVQVTSCEYLRPSQLRPGGVLLVGAGNSGAELALELARQGHPTWLSGRDVGQVPFRITGRAGRRVLAPLLLRVVFHRLLTLDTPMGRKARPSIVSKGGPLIRARRGDLAAAGVRFVPRVTGARGGLPVVEGGEALPVANVIWCTGYEPGFSWIDLPVLEADGHPRQRRGVVPGEPGLYFLGLHFMYAMSSGMIHGVGRDAAHVAATLARRAREAQAAQARATAAPPAPEALATPRARA
ncbi:MAG: NAD(P)-binding domain-containing protein [Anaeromyxobacter sp.]